MWGVRIQQSFLFTPARSFFFTLASLIPLHANWVFRIHSFNRHDALQQIATRSLLAAIERGGWDNSGDDIANVLGSMAKTLQDPDPELCGSFKALCLTLPSTSQLADQVAPGTADIHTIDAVRKELRSHIGAALSTPLLSAVVGPVKSSAPSPPRCLFERVSFDILAVFVCLVSTAEP